MENSALVRLTLAVFYFQSSGPQRLSMLQNGKKLEHCRRLCPVNLDYSKHAPNQVCKVKR